MAEDMSMDNMNDEITSDDKLWAMLSMIFGIVGIIALVLEDKKDRPFIRYYAIHGIVLMLISFVLSFACIGVIVWVYAIFLGIKAYSGEYVEVPVITDLARGQGWIAA